MTPSLQREWEELLGHPATASAFAPEMIADLPELVRRWLSHAITPGTPLWPAVELTMRGQIRIGLWRPFTARQVLVPGRGFIWAATARVAGLPVTGFDRFTGGSGQMRWRLASVLPVMSGTGADITRSAAGRLAAEGVSLLPTAFRTASWVPGPEPDTVVAAVRVDGTDEGESVQLRIGDDGRLREVLMQRWGTPDRQPAGRYPFGVQVEAERTFDGVTMAARFRAGWWAGTDRAEAGEFFRAEITGAAFS
jgi:hypothetical protein